MQNRSTLSCHNRFTTKLALATFALTLGSLIAGSGTARAQGFGTVKGRLVWGGDTIPDTKVLRAKGSGGNDGEFCAKDGPILSRDLVIDPKTKGIANGFAYLVRPAKKNPAAVKALVAKSPSIVLDQKNCEFLPFVVAMHQDQKLILKSSDPVAHNVRMSGFANSGFNQNLPPMGTLEVKLKADRVPLTAACDIHPWMTSYVMVFDHPFFAITGPDGSFEIKGVPAGPAKIVVRQEKAGYVTEGKGAGMAITVAADTVTDLGDIKLDPAKIR